MNKTGAKCLFEFDKDFKKTIIGTDEAGRGPAAGGVFASAVYFPEISKKIIDELSILNDSKQLSAKKREYLYDIILNETINETVCVEVEDIEKYNILSCSLRAMKLACVILFKDTATPSISALQRRINLMGQWVSAENPELKMATTDIHSARGVVCMGRNNTIFYGPYEHAISIAPPEAPQIQSRVIETTPVSVELYVTTSQECKVWCLPVLASDVKKTVDEVKAGTFRFVRNRVSLFFQGLKPQTQYDIWCYGETKNGVPSDDLITARAETKSGRSHFPVSFVVEFKVILEDVTQNLISFSLENNLRQDARCLLLDDSSNQVRTTNVKYQKNTPVHFSGLNSHSLYYIRCEVTAKEKGRNTVIVLAETGLVPVKTTRSFLSSLLLSLFFIALFTLVLTVVLFIVRSRSNGFLNK